MGGMTHKSKQVLLIERCVSILRPHKVPHQLLTSIHINSSFQVWQMCLIQAMILNGHLYFSGVWLGVNLRAGTKKTCWKKKKRLDYVLKTILNVLVNAIEGTYIIIY